MPDEKGRLFAVDCAEILGITVTDWTARVYRTKVAPQPVDRIPDRGHMRPLWDPAEIESYRATLAMLRANRPESRIPAACDAGGMTWYPTIPGPPVIEPPCTKPVTHRYRTVGMVENDWGHRCAEHVRDLSTTGLVIEPLSSVDAGDSHA